MRTFLTLALTLVINVAFAQHYTTNGGTMYEQLGSGSAYTRTRVVPQGIIDWYISNTKLQCDLYESVWKIKKVTSTKEGKKYLVDMGELGGLGFDMWVVVGPTVITLYSDNGQSKGVFRITSKRPLN